MKNEHGITEATFSGWWMESNIQNGLDSIDEALGALTQAVENVARTNNASQSLTAVYAKRISQLGNRTRQMSQSNSKLRLDMIVRSSGESNSIEAIETA